MVARNADGVTALGTSGSRVDRPSGFATTGTDETNAGGRTRRLEAITTTWTDETHVGDRTRRLQSVETEFIGSENQDWAVPIPTGSFTPVVVTVRDVDGEPLPEIEWIMSAGIFPTAGRVNANAKARLWLLKVDYEEFMAVAPRGEPKGMDYTWYSTAERQEPVTPASQLEADIYVDPEELSGLLAGSSGIEFGGMFG